MLLTLPRLMVAGLFVTWTCRLQSVKTVKQLQSGSCSPTLECACVHLQLLTLQTPVCCRHLLPLHSAQRRRTDWPCRWGHASSALPAEEDTTAQHSHRWVPRSLSSFHRPVSLPINRNATLTFGLLVPPQRSHPSPRSLTAWPRSRQPAASQRRRAAMRSGRERATPTGS